MATRLRHNIRRATAALVIAAAGVLAAAPPAAAHTLDEAVRSGEGCTWASGSYTTLHSTRLTYGAEYYGTVYLLWHGGRGENCVVTLKGGATHGVSGYTEAVLRVQGGPTREEGERFSHYAAVNVAARGACVSYEGTIVHPTTLRPVSGGRPGWDNCG
ncbi:hypothetical protein ACFO4E_19855 [Nocardiopsis mangrovi]|uniref:Spore-associated protein A n=1 Tax=Nocardiopsis mangrovi TaxID=1179818 RepID=A0ABV9E1N6_9ACTN